MSSLKFKGGSEVQYVDKQRGISVVLDGSDLKSKKTKIFFLCVFQNFCKYLTFICKIVICFINWLEIFD